MARQNKNNTAAATVAVLKEAFEAAEIALNAITETATVEEKAAAQTVVDEAKTVLDAIADPLAVEERATAQSDFDAANVELERITALPSPEEKEAAQIAFDAAKSAYEAAIAIPAAAKTKEKTLKGVFVVSPTGKYNLAYNVGEPAEFPELQAIELEEAGYFKIAK